MDNNISVLEKFKKQMPGLLLAVILTVTAYMMSNIIGNIIGGANNPFNPIMTAIILGLLLRNMFKIPETYTEGIKFGVKKVLRLGIILMGIRLSIVSVLKIGVVSVGLVVVCITGALVITLLLSKKINVSRKLGTLIAAGTSICGVSAILAAAPAIEADEEETAYAIGTITIFGLIATMAYPYLAELVLQLDVIKAGFFLGTSVHDTSQVTATALIYDELWGHKTAAGFSGADIAITTKLVRNTFMIAVIPVLGYLFKKNKSGRENGEKTRLLQYIPVFVLGYVLFGVLRSVGDMAFGENNALWVDIWNFIKEAATYIITVAIVCVGLSTDVKKIVRLGLKPLVVGFVAAVSVGMISFVLVTLFEGYLSF